MGKKSFPLCCPDAPTEQRFSKGDWVAHCAGVIERSSKRCITEVIGYDKHGGVQYRLKDDSDADRGLAYDCELESWPGDDAVFPITLSYTKVV